MSRILDVYLHRQRVGTLTQNNQGDIGLEYDENYRNNPAARPLSQSLPLAKKRYNRRECRPFFAGILSTKMAMKIGGESNPEKVGPSQIEKQANEAALSVPMVRNRMTELADAIQATLPAATSEERFALAVAGQISSRCQRMKQRFRR
jgi:HipA-like protein